MVGFAYVWLVMKGDNYIPGAITSALSMKNVETKYDLVLMVTPDVSDDAKKLCRVIFDKVIEIDYLQYETKKALSERQEKLYENWTDVSYTKWQCLNKKKFPYKKVLFLDADLLILKNIDHLFDLKTPAGCFTNPWAKPLGKIDNPYYDYFKKEPELGDTIPSEIIKDGLDHKFVATGAIILLEPKNKIYKLMKSELNKLQPFGYPVYSASDEQILAHLYSVVLKKSWQAIPFEYNFMGWKREPNGEIYIFHYLHDKPWEMSRDKWEDLDMWYSYGDKLKKLFENKKLIEEFNNIYPVDELEKPKLDKCYLCKINKEDNNHTFNKHINVKGGKNLPLIDPNFDYMVGSSSKSRFKNAVKKVIKLQKANECAFYLDKNDVCSDKEMQGKIQEFLKIKGENITGDYKKDLEKAKKQTNCNSESCVIKHDDIKNIAGWDLIRKNLKRFKPDGSLKQKHLLSNFNIDEVLDQLSITFKDFKHIPFQMRDFDKTKTELSQIDLARESRKYNKFGCVLNTDYSSGGGIHWFCLFGQLNTNPITLEYFNSSGNKPITEVQIWLHKTKNYLESKLEGRKVDIIYVAKEELQDDNYSCGVWSLVYILFRLQGVKPEWFNKHNVNDELIVEMRKHLFNHSSDS